MRIERKLAIMIGTVLALLLLGVIFEVIRCRNTALPRVVNEGDLVTYKKVVEQFGAPDRETMFASGADLSHGAFGVRLPESLPSSLHAAGVRASLWNRRCFCVAEHRVVVFSSQTGSVIFIGGHSRMFFPMFVSPDFPETK